MGKPGPVRNDTSIYGDRSDAWWGSADPIFAPLHALAPARLSLIERTFGSWKGLDVIDVGCGGGYMSETLARGGGRVVGVDLAQGALDAASARFASQGLSGHFVRASAGAIPLISEGFDLAVCTDVLVHVPDPGPVINEIGRLLRPGGRLYFSTINRNLLSRLVMITLGEDLLGVVYKGTHDPEKFITPDEMWTMCRDAGLTPGDAEGIGPKGLTRQFGFVFGRWPTCAVMYQGWADKA